MSKFNPKLTNSRRSLLTRQPTLPESPANILAVIRAFFYGITTSTTFANSTYGEDLHVLFP